MNTRNNCPSWLGNAHLSVARDERDNIIGVSLLCLIEHDRIVDLPEMFAEQAHSLLDDELRKDVKL